MEMPEPYLILHGINFICEKVEKWNLDVLEQYNHFQDLYPHTYRTSEVFKCKYIIQSENGLSGYMAFLVSDFLKEIYDKCIKTPRSSLELFADGGASFYGDPSFSIAYTRDPENKFCAPIEFKLEKHFRKSLQKNDEDPEEFDLVEFYNNCPDHQGRGYCTHYCCKAVFQMYIYMCSSLTEYGLLSTYERTYMLKLTSDRELSIAGPFRRKAPNGLVDIPFFRPLSVLFFLVATSPEKFSIKPIQVRSY